MESEARATGYHHKSVLLTEVVAALRPAPGRLIVDGTVGGGGHAEALLEAGAKVVGIDRDTDALQAAHTRLSGRFGERLQLIHGNFGDIESLLKSVGLSSVDGVLLDLGVSSWQLDAAARGFSFQREGKLDMRMDHSSGRTAADLVNAMDEASLTRIFREYGQEPHARRIARAIVHQRVAAPFETTTELALLIERVVGRRGRLHPATRAFQALRIAVNEEIDSLRRALDALPRILLPGGRVAVISFHSLEDREVKKDFRDKAMPEIDQPDWPGPRPNPSCFYRRITGKPIEPTLEEIRDNPRARSARLRVVERLPTS